MTKVIPGFIGLGIMGKSMALNLLKAGFPLAVFNRSPRPAAELREAGAHVVDSPAALAEVADIIFTSVSDDPALTEIVSGERGIVQSEKRRATLMVDHSTVSPSTARAAGEALMRAGIAFIDAPVSGGDVGARNGTLTIMAGGEEKDLARARPYLEKMGANIVHTGGAGTGQMTKCVNQIVVALNVAAMTEGLAIAESFGLDLQKTLDTIGSGAAGSWSLANYGPRVLRGDLAPGFRAEHMLKDLEIALREAAARGTNLPMAELVTGLYQKLVTASGLTSGAIGNHALIKLYQGSGE